MFRFPTGLLSCLFVVAMCSGAEPCGSATTHLVALFGDTDRERLKSALSDAAPLGVDHLTDQILVRGKAVEIGDWKRVLNLTDSIKKMPGVRFGEGVASSSFLESPLRVTGKENTPFHLQELRLLTDELSTGSHINQCIVVCRDSLHVGSHLTNSIILAGGDVKVTTHVANSILIASGNVEVASHVTNSVILAKGTVKIGSFTEGNVIEQRGRSLFGVLGFFETSRLGVETMVVGDRLRIERLHPKKAFAAAGLKAGDYILAVNKNVVRSNDDFRIQLRRASASNAKILLTILRDEKKDDVSVTLSK